MKNVHTPSGREPRSLFIRGDSYALPTQGGPEVSPSFEVEEDLLAVNAQAIQHGHGFINRQS